MRPGKQQLADSHRFLRAKTLDLVQVHNLQDLDTHLATLRTARDGGTVRYIGVTHYVASAHAELERVTRREKPDFLQVNYSLAEPDAGERLLPAARDLGVAVLVNRPFTKGAMIDRAAGQALPPVAAELGCRSAAQLFIKWVLGDPAVTVVLAATRNPRHAAENLEAASGARARCRAAQGNRGLVFAALKEILGLRRAGCPRGTPVCDPGLGNANENDYYLHRVDWNSASGDVL